jgi:hypothetical protein
MGYKYIFLVIAGVVIIATALPAAYRLRSPWSVVAALAALAGVVTSLAGVLLFAVPHFLSR